MSQFIARVPDKGMAGKAETEVSIQDKARSGAAFAALVVGVALFYFMDEQGLFYRVAVILGMTTVAAALFFTTARGRETAVFLRGARVELQRMVWPTRSETVHATLVVFAMIFIVAIFLWALDLFLAWFMQIVIK